MLANVDGPLSPALRAVIDQPGRAASVLLTLLERPTGITVLFTERAAHLKDHAGQISFPGGRLAHEGESPVDAALRDNSALKAHLHAHGVPVRLAAAAAAASAEFGRVA